MWPNPGMGKREISKRQIKEIAARLIRTRIALDLKPADLCRLTEIKPNTYSQWENERGRPQLDEAIRLCEILGYTLDWIYLGDPRGLPFGLASKLGLGSEEALRKAG